MSNSNHLSKQKLVLLKVINMNEVNPEQKEALEDILNYLNDREEWNASKKNYFDIVHTGYQKDLEREEIQVHAGKNGNVFLIKTEEGFVVDVYGQNDIVDTLAVWEDTLNPLEDDDDEPIDPNNFSLVEQENFLDHWGQLTDEVCAELGYDEETSDDLLMVDYFYYEPKKYWIPKSASMYTPREQSIADYLKLG